MANTKSLRLAVGAIFPKGPGKIYFYRYQVDGRRKTVSLQTANRAEALKKAQHIVPQVVPKKQFTGMASERIDVRVLHVVFTFDSLTWECYSGEQLEVFLDLDSGTK